MNIKLGFTMMEKASLLFPDFCQAPSSFSKKAVASKTLSRALNLSGSLMEASPLRVDVPQVEGVHVSSGQVLCPFHPAGNDRRWKTGGKWSLLSSSRLSSTVWKVFPDGFQIFALVDLQVESDRRR
jgi:hypothetical protein